MEIRLTNVQLLKVGRKLVTFTLVSGNFARSKNRSYTVSFNTSSADFFENVFSKDAQVQKSGLNTVPVYLYKSFKHYASNFGSKGTASTASLVSGSHSSVDLTNSSFNH